MRKIIVIISILLVMCFYTNVHALALNATEINLNANINEDNSLIVDVYISENSNITALGFEINYDQSIISPLRIQESNLAQAGMIQWNDTNEGKIIVSYINIKPLLESGNLLSIEYNILDSNVEDIVLSINVTEAINNEYENIDYISKGVEIKNPKNLNATTENEVVEDSSTETVEETQCFDSVSKDTQFKIQNEVKEEQIIQPIKEVIKSDNIKVYLIKTENEKIIDKNNNILAVFVEDKNGLLSRIDSSVDDYSGGKTFEPINNDANIYIVEEAQSQVETSITTATNDTIEPNIDNCWITIIVALIICTFAIILVIIKIKQNNKKKVSMNYEK